MFENLTPAEYQVLLQATGFSRGATWGRPDASTLALYLGTTWDTFPIPKYFHGSFPKYIGRMFRLRY